MPPRGASPRPGITRIGANVQNQVNGIAAQLAAKGLIQIQDNFLWSVEDSPIVVRQPPPQEPPRPIEEIAIGEIAEAAFLNLQEAFSLTREDLLTQTARLLGYDRAGEKVKSRVLCAIDLLGERNLIKSTNGKIELVS